MRQIVAWTLTLVLLLVPLSVVHAVQYTDEENLLVVEVPDDESTVWYAADKAYLPDDMQELKDSLGLDARLIVRSYTPEDVLAVSLDVVTCPLDSLSETEHAAPAAGRSASGYTDINAADIRDQALELARSMYGSRFRLSAATAGVFDGHPDLEIQGVGQTGAHWADYDCSIFLLTNTERLVIVTAVYLQTEKEAAGRLLGSVSVDNPPPAPVAADPSAAATAAAAETPLPEAAAAATLQTSAPPAASGEREAKWIESLRDIWNAHPYLPYYILLAVAAVLLAVGLAVYIRASKQRKWMMEDDGAGSSSAPVRSRTHRQSRSSKADKEDRMESNGLSRSPEQDYAEDISRYTQQPGPEVNDVSRYTHGYDSDDSLSSELKALQDAPLVTPKAVSTASVGSRVERNRRKKRK